MKAKIFTFVRGLKNGTPPRFQSYLKSLTLLLAMVVSVNVWGGDASFDLTTSSYSSSSEDEVIWSSSPVTVTLSKNTGTKANNYLGGSGSYTHTRVYSGNTFSVSVSNGYYLSSVVITSTTSDYLLPTTGWTGGTASASGSVVTVTANTNTQTVSVNPGGTKRLTKVEVTYTTSGPVQKYNLTYHVGSASTTIQVNSGTKLSTALKDVTTTSCDDNSTTFIGWSTKAITGKIQSAPEELLDEDATVTEDMEVWAVWAHATITPAGETETIWSETFGDAGTSSTQDVSSYTGFSGKTTGISYTASSAKVSKSNTNTCTLTGTSGKSNLYSTNGGSLGTFTVSGINTKGYENLVLKFNFKYASTSGKSLSVSANNTSLSVSSTSTTNWQAITCGSGIPSVNSLTLVFSGKSNGQVFFDDIILTGNTPASATYSDYLTTCCTSWSAPTLSYPASASIGAQLDPSWGAGTTHGTLTYSSSDEDVLEVNATSGVVTTKAAGTAHVIASWSSVGDYCDNSTNSNEITVTAAYNITYKDKGGADFSGTHEDGYPQTHTYGTATTLKGASKDYYNFDGWFTNESCTGTAIQTVAADAYTANFTLYAKWTPIEYNITYTLNGGTNASGNPAKYTYETETITLQAPSKIGHDFQGWFKESTFENQVITIEKGSHGNVDLYAKWLVKNYTLTWDLNGGSVKTAGTTAGSVAFGTALIAPTVERTGYEFTGWKKGNTSIDFTNTVTMPAENATYVAQWTAEIYVINYKDENNAEFTGSMSGLPTTHTYDTPTPLVNSSKTGYNFIGWFTDPACTTPISTLGATDYLDAITLFAKWSEIMPTDITLNPDLTEITDLIYDDSNKNTKTITATVNPSTAFNTAFEWSVVEGSDVVSVNENGLITALKAGSAKVKVASTRVPTIYKEISVTVHALPQITWKNMDGSTFTTSKGTSAGKVGSLPANKPTSCDTEKYPYFRGWSATNFGKTTTNPESGFVTKDTEVALDEEYTYYAVFSSKVASLNFGTPAVSDDFESCTEQTSNSQFKPGTISNCGIFTSCYNGNNSNYYGVQSDSYGKYLHVKGSSSPLSLSYDNSTNFSTTGAWSVKINKGANCDFGFYSTGASNNYWTNANARVYMRYSNGSISVGNGSNMVSTGYTYSGSAEVVEITMIYNATSNATTYGDGITLGAEKAHVYVNGEAIMNGDAPKEMAIVKTATKYFRIASTSTTVAKFYDVNIYNALPTTTSIEGCEWATQCCTPWTPTLSYANTTMQVGEEQDAVVGTYYGTATYTSNKPSSVEVDETTGHIKAVGGGTATISVTWTGDDTYCEQSTSSQEITVNGLLQVSFNGNGADGGTEMEAQAVEYGVATNINKNTYTKTGYTFLGWNTDKDATSILYTDEQSVTFMAGVELFAIWRINAHTVTVQDAPGGTIAIVSTTTIINYGTTVTATATLATGYNFVTWSATPSVTFAEATNKNTTFSMPDNDVLLTAEYTPILVTQIDLKKGGNVVTALEFEKGVTDPVTLTTSFTPADALDKTVEWQSGNTNVVTVNNGVLTAQGLGTAVVTATSTVVPTVAGSVTVTVYEWQDADPVYTLTNQPASTVYYETNKINFSNWTIEHNFKRSDDATKIKQETVASSDWTVTLGGETIANEYTLTTADNGKALVIKVGETTLYNETLTVNEKAKHTYIDRVHGNEDIVKMDSYTIPSLNNAATATEGDCATTHYVFKGWVAEANADVPTDANLIAVGGSKTAEADATFYAVWAEHRSVTEETKLTYGWENGETATGWTINSGLTTISTANHTGSNAGQLGSGADMKTGKIDKPISIKYYLRKLSTNKNASNCIELQYSSNGTSGWTGIEEAEHTNEDLENDNTKWTEVDVDLSTYTSKYFRIIKTGAGSAAQAIDDITFIYEETTQKDVDYITECVTRYELTFDANGGTGTAPETIMLKEGGKINLPNATLTKAYNAFSGWNTKADGKGTSYAVGAEYTMGATATTLYADWAPRAVESLEITTPATTLEFGIGQTFSSEGLKVKATYEGGETETDVDFTTNFDNYVFTASDEGQKTVKVSYKGFDADLYQITVAPALIVRFFVNGTQIQEKAVFDKKIGAMPNAMTSDAWTNPENQFIASHYPIFAGWTLATSDDNIAFINEGTGITTDVNVNAVFAKSATPDLDSKTLATSIDPSKRYVIVDGDYYYNGEANNDWGVVAETKAEVLTFYGKSAPYAIQQTDGKYFKVPSSHKFYLQDDPVYNFQLAIVESEYFLQVTTTNEYLRDNSDYSVNCLRWYGTGTGSATYLYSVEVEYDHLTIAPKGDHVRTGLTFDQAGTICLPYAVKADDYTGASVWSIESRTGTGTMISSITLVQEVEDDGITKKDLVAGKPYIFFAEESEFQLFYSGDEYKLSEHNNQTVAANGLIGNLDENNIVINGGGYQPGSYLINQNKLMECGANCQVPQYRAYVEAEKIGAEPIQAPIMAPRRYIGNPNSTPTNMLNINGSNKATKMLINDHIVILRDNKMYNAQGLFVK